MPLVFLEFRPLQPISKFRETMHSRLSQLVDQFAHNPPLAGKAMREMLESDGSTFTQQALALLKTVSVDPGSNYVLTLLLVTRRSFRSFAIPTCFPWRRRRKSPDAFKNSILVLTFASSSRSPAPPQMPIN